MRYKLKESFVKKWQENQVIYLKKIGSGDGLSPIKARAISESMKLRTEQENLEISRRDILKLIREIETEIQAINPNKKIFFSEDKAPVRQVHCSYHSIKNQQVYLRHFSPYTPNDKSSIMWGFRLMYYYSKKDNNDL